MLLMKDMERIRNKVGVIFFLSILGYGLSFCNQLIISYHFGTSSSLDVYWTSLAIINFLCFYLHPFKESLIPIVHHAIDERMIEASEILSAGMIFLTVLVMLSSCVLIFLPDLIDIFSKRNQTTFIKMLELLPWLLPFLWLFTFSETLNSILVCLDKVIFQSIVKVFASTFSLALLFFVSKSLGVKAIYVALLAGQFVVTFMSLYALRNYSFKFKFDFLSVLKEKRFFNLFTSLIVSYLIAQFYILSERTAMVDMQAGLLSSFQYSASLVNVLVGVVAVPISTSIWHTFLQAKVTKNHKKAEALALKASYALFILMTLICSFSFVNAREIIYLIFSRGQFDEASLLLTTQTFKAVIFVALVIGLTNIFGRFLISIARARDNAIIGILTAVFGMSVIFISWFYGYSNVIQWHWLVANLIGLVFSLWLFVHKCQIGFSKVFHGLKSIFITIAICIISLYVRPEFYFGESKFFVFLALAINFLLFVFIAFILSVVTGHLKKIKIFLYGNL